MGELRSHEPMMTMKAAVASIQEKANKGHSLALAVSYSLRYDKHHSNPILCRSPVEMLNLWKPCILPHFLLYLHYISDASQVQTLQASLNQSLSTTLHVYGHPTVLLAETGISHLYITQNLQLAQLRFRLHSSSPAIIQHFPLQFWQPLLQVVPLHTLETRMQTAVCHVDMAPMGLMILHEKPNASGNQTQAQWSFAAEAWREVMFGILSPTC